VAGTEAWRGTPGGGERQGAHCAHSPKPTARTGHSCEARMALCRRRYTMVSRSATTGPPPVPRNTAKNSWMGLKPWSPSATAGKNVAATII
jgi:hypothetical protein